MHAAASSPCAYTVECARRCDVLGSTAGMVPSLSLASCKLFVGMCLSRLNGR